MIVAITGDRNWSAERYHEVRAALACLDPKTDHVVLGDARGVDSLAQHACDELGLDHTVHVADWSRGRRGGPERNRRMLMACPDEVWYFHDDLTRSKGTWNMITQASYAGFRVRNASGITARTL